MQDVFKLCFKQVCSGVHLQMQICDEDFDPLYGKHSVVTGTTIFLSEKLALESVGEVVLHGTFIVIVVTLGDYDLKR